MEKTFKAKWEAACRRGRFPGRFVLVFSVMYGRKKSPKLLNLFFQIDLMVLFVFTVALFASSVQAKSTKHPVLRGVAQVVDGDTVKIGQKSIRIHGIDAPEKKQMCKKNGKFWKCGIEAINLMRRILSNRVITCQALGADRYGRTIGRCYSQGEDIGKRMVAAGLAQAYRRYSKDYISAEVTAKLTKKGLWIGEFVAPWDWRRGKRLGSASQKIDKGCLIKGNIGRAGERIYHLPGGLYYSRTKIDPRKKERFFCSEEEAQKAGWRRSKR